MDEKEKLTLQDVHYVKLVSIGSVNPNNLLSDEAREKQVELLNRCLNDYPKGIIMGKDKTIGRYMLGEHELTLERVTYHIGFRRRPPWDEER
jgi:hypothetical protein